MMRTSINIVLLFYYYYNLFPENIANFSDVAGMLDVSPAQCEKGLSVYW
jgi:hypothetical protein